MPSGVEPNASNTINNSCVDGNSGTYRSDESVERVSIRTVDHGPLSVGKQVTAEVTVWCWGSTDRFDLYYTTNASAPSWTALTTNGTCTAGSRTFTHTFNLGATPGNHAIRAQFRYGGTASACTSGSYNDRDDLVFGVSAAVASTAPEKARSVQGRSTQATR
ncbi:hypothetical protein ACLEPN_05070 [Myxococcus sp. 1LA]